MRNLLFILCVMLTTITSFSRDFQYTYEGKTLTYSVIDLDAKTCRTREGTTGPSYSPGNQVSGNLIIPSVVSDGRHNFTVTEIGDYAFYGCSDLTSASIPNSVTRIGWAAFEGCSGLSEMNIPNSVTEIETYGFHGCSGLKKLTISNSLRQINTAVFQGCSSLTDLTIPNSVEEIGTEAFDSCSGLTEVSFSNSLTYIGNWSFSDCAGLTEVVLPPSLKTIRSWAFGHDVNLTTIIMGSCVKEIDASAFEGCPASKVYITAQTPPRIIGSGNLFSNSSGKLYVQGDDVVDKFFYAEQWGNYEVEVMVEPTELKIVNDRTIIGCPRETFQLTAKLYPENVTLPYLFWSSSNTEVATVDDKGLVTIHGGHNDILTVTEDNDSFARTCKITAKSLYADSPVAEVIVCDSTSGVEKIIYNGEYETIDYDNPISVYDLRGIQIADTIDQLFPGIYIVRQGQNVQKVVVK